MVPDGDALAAARDPAEELAEVTAVAAALFFAAEHDENAAVGEYWDAVQYVTATLAAGHVALFPVTMMGKLIGSILQTVGPSLACPAVDPAVSRARATESAQLLGRLDAILAELRAQRVIPAGGLDG